MNNYKVLIISNDANSVSNLQIPLQSYGYQVMSINQNISKVKSNLKIFLPDIVLIDSDADAQNTMILAKYIIKKEIPSLVCTEMIEIDMIQKISRIEACALFIKPFNLLNIHATIQISVDKYKKEKIRKESANSLKLDNDNLRQLLFGKEIIENTRIHFGSGFYFQPSTCETYYDNKRVPLTQKENRFIQLLVSNIGHTINFEQAIKYIWDKANVSENNVRTLIWRLRSKLQANVIKTISGVGYYVEEAYSESNETIFGYTNELQDSA